MMNINSFLRFVDALSLRHDPYENSHAVNTATLVKGLAELSGYPGVKMEALDIASRVHDVGKLLIPERVLNKQTKLTMEEIAMIHRHVQIGYDAIKAFTDWDPLIADAVIQHHERYDGTGYPQGLRGERIILEARIIAICDTFDALTSARAYRKALAPEDATEIMTADSAFDPILLDMFLRMVHKL